ncbi:hypothetical protein D3C81_1434810 [compost metagenome]
MVPHHFHTILRNREGDVAGLFEVLQAVAVVHRLGGHRTLLHRVIDRLRCRSGTAGLEYRNLVGFRIALEHRLLAGGQLVLVLRHVGLGDDEQWLVVGERIAEEAFGIHRCGVGLEAASPLGNAAVGIASLLTAQRSQGGAQLGRLVRRNGRHYAACQQRQSQSTHFHHCCCFHTSVPASVLLTWISRRKEVEIGIGVEVTGEGCCIDPVVRPSASGNWW